MNAGQKGAINITGCIVTYNNAETIVKCIDTLFSYNKKYKMVLYIVDNGSTDGTIELIRERYPKVKLILSKQNLGFGRGHNLVLPYLKDVGYHFVINPDLYWKEDSVAAMVDFMESNADTIASCTPKIINPNGSRQYLPQKEPSLRYVLFSKIPFLTYLRKEYTRESMNLEQPTEIDFCTGCFFCVKSDIFRQIGGFDERYFMYFEDADLSKKLRKTHKIFFYPYTAVIHTWKRDNIRSAIGRKRFLISMYQYFKKWGWKI